MNKYQVIAVFLLRISLGAIFIYGGMSKLIEVDWTAAGYLANDATGPFKEFFVSMSGSSLVDNLVIWGEIGIGVALFLGVFLRFACYCGALMMFLFYIAVLPKEHGPFNDQFFYGITFIALALIGAGRYFGVDMYLEKFLPEKNNKILKLFLG